MSDQPQDQQAVERYTPVWDHDSTMRTVACMEPSPYGLYVRLDAYVALRKDFAEFYRKWRDGQLITDSEPDCSTAIASLVESMESMPQKGGERCEFTNSL